VSSSKFQNPHSSILPGGQHGATFRLTAVE
jgi:hypothetical protein